MRIFEYRLDILDYGSVNTLCKVGRGGHRREAASWSKGHSLGSRKKHEKGRLTPDETVKKGWPE